MATYEGNGFRSLDQYKRSYNERMTYPELMDQVTIYTILLRVVNPPRDNEGAYSHLVRVANVDKTALGLYTVQFVFLSNELKEQVRPKGEFFDGVWNSAGNLGVKDAAGRRHILKDGFVTEVSTPPGGGRVISEARGRELVGV